MNLLTQSKNTTLLLVLIALTLACFALSPQAQATCQDACLSNNNTVQGDDALISLTTGTNNTAIGFQALYSNVGGVGFDGSYNTATGSGAMEANTTGFNNTATGIGALVFNTTGSGNTATGQLALRSNGTGNNNIAMGQLAGYFITGSNNIDIGNAGAPNESNKIRIGTNGTHTNTFIAGISGVTVANGVGVIIDTRGHLGTVVSSERFKEEIKPMDKASEAILALKPVTFRYNKELDPENIPQFGLVAEDVEKVNPALVARDEQGKPYTVRYEAVNAMLLNEFLKAHRKMEEQDATIAKQQKQIEALTAGLQKVNAQLEVSKAAPQTVQNNQ
jgi:hypothetical protein